MEIKTTSGRVFGKRKKKEQPEAPVKNAIRQYLELKGWFVMVNVASQFTQGKLRGRPDLEALKRGYVIFIETKKPARFENGHWLPEGKLREDQVAYIDDLVRHKAKVFVTSNSEEFMRELDELEERLWPGENLRRLC
jgi:hypothetical protein